jgi:acyl-CoA-binding protein
MCVQLGFLRDVQECVTSARALGAEAAAIGPVRDALLARALALCATGHEIRLGRVWTGEEVTRRLEEDDDAWWGISAVTGAADTTSTCSSHMASAGGRAVPSASELLESSQAYSEAVSTLDVVDACCVDATRVEALPQKLRSHVLLGLSAISEQSGNVQLAVQQAKMAADGSCDHKAAWQAWGRLCGTAGGEAQKQAQGVVQSWKDSHEPVFADVCI